MRKPPGKLSLKKFGLGRIWVKKVFWVKSVFGSKKFLVQKLFGSKGFWGQKSFWVKKVFRVKQVVWSIFSLNWVNLRKDIFVSSKNFFWCPYPPHPPLPDQFQEILPRYPYPKLKNSWGRLSSTFHVERPETLIEWKFESITDQRTNGRTNGQTYMGRC